MNDSNMRLSSKQSLWHFQSTLGGEYHTITVAATSHDSDPPQYVASVVSAAGEIIQAVTEELLTATLQAIARARAFDQAQSDEPMLAWVVAAERAEVRP